MFDDHGGRLGRRGLAGCKRLGLGDDDDVLAVDLLLNTVVLFKHEVVMRSRFARLRALRRRIVADVAVGTDEDVGVSGLDSHDTVRFLG